MTDDTLDDTDGTSEVESGAPSLADELLARDTEIAELKDRLLRAAAEQENTRRRLERERADAVAYASTKFARDMLGVADNLRRAVAALPADAPGFEGVRTGIEATERELSKVLGQHGIVRIETDGQPLDPNRHQAMIEVESDLTPGSIVGELQSGYMIKDRLLRPALVTVAKAKAEPTE